MFRIRTECGLARGRSHRDIGCRGRVRWANSQPRPLGSRGRAVIRPEVSERRDRRTAVNGHVFPWIHQGDRCRPVPGSWCVQRASRGGHRASLGQPRHTFADLHCRRRAPTATSHQSNRRVRAARAHRDHLVRGTRAARTDGRPEHDLRTLRERTDPARSTSRSVRLEGQRLQRRTRSLPSAVKPGESEDTVHRVQVTPVSKPSDRTAIRSVTEDSVLCGHPGKPMSGCGLYSG